MKKKLFIVTIMLLGVAVLILTQGTKPATLESDKTVSSERASSSRDSVKPDNSNFEAAIVSKTGTAKDEAAKDSASHVPTVTKTENPNDYGITQPVRADLNPQVASVSEALRSKKNPERLSPLIQPKPFDPEAYRKDSAAYLNVVEPGRCFQSKNPGKDVPKIQSLSPQFQQVAQGQSVSLRVQAQAKFPVTFTSFDMGKFQNELTSITVEANESGIAETKFYGAAGTIDEVKILASSPMTSGQIQFLVNVTK